MNLKQIYKRLPLQAQKKYRRFAEKLYYLFCLATFRQALLHPIGKVGIPFIARPYLRRSFSQQGEDLILDRLITRVLKLRRPGIYVDVGAYHAVDHSVTYCLYQKNWRGIAFDPSKETLKTFRFYRKRDEFVLAAVGDEDKEKVSFYIPKDTSSMSLINTKYPPPPSQESYDEVFVRQVNLNEELKRRSISEFDVLNIDVEGAELEILTTFDFGFFKPKIVALEIHGNNVLQALETEEAKIILEAGYRCAGCAVITYFFVREESIKE